MKILFVAVLHIFLSLLLISCEDDKSSQIQPAGCVTPQTTSMILPPVSLYLVVDKVVGDQDLYYLITNDKVIKLNCTADDVENTNRDFYCVRYERATSDEHYDILKIESFPVLGSDAASIKVILKDRATEAEQKLEIKLTKSQRQVTRNVGTCSEYSYQETTYIGIITQSL